MPESEFTHVRAHGPPAGPTKPRSTLQRQPDAAATAVDVVLLLLGHDVHDAAPVLALNEPTAQADNRADPTAMTSPASQPGDPIHMCA